MAVAAEFGGGTLHRFSIQLPASTRGKPLYAYAQALVAGEVQIPWLCFGDWWCAWQ